MMICSKPVLTYLATFIITWDLKYSQYTTECYFGQVPGDQLEENSIKKKKGPSTQRSFDFHTKRPTTETNIEYIPLLYHKYRYCWSLYILLMKLDCKSL